MHSLTKFAIVGSAIMIEGQVCPMCCDDYVRDMCRMPLTGIDKIGQGSVMLQLQSYRIIHNGQ
jgi:hypothetical protein